MPQHKPSQTWDRPAKGGAASWSQDLGRPPQQGGESSHSTTDHQGAQYEELLIPAPSTDSPRALLDPRAMITCLEQLKWGLKKEKQ